MRSFEKLEVNFQLLQISVAFQKSIEQHRFKPSENLLHTFKKLKLFVIKDICN